MTLSSYASAIRWFAWPLLLQHKGRNLAAIIAIAAGIALALAIHTINRTAVSEFARAMGKINGTVQLQIKSQSGYLSDDIFFQLMAIKADGNALLGVAHLSPVLEVESSIIGGGRAKIIGIDPLSAAYITPALLGRPTQKNPANQQIPFNFFDGSALFSAQGQTAKSVVLQTPQGPLQFNVNGSTGLEDANTYVGDIAQVQTLWNLTNKLTRIDVALYDQASLEQNINEIKVHLAQAIANGQVRLVEPKQEVERMSNISRAYRVNLTVLALVALVTGGLIVFSSQAAAVLKQWSTISLVSLLGASRAWVMTIVIGQGLIIGAIGTVLGIVSGYLLAATLLIWVGTDLGGGYFSSKKTWPQLGASELIVFFLAGLGVSLLATWFPARAALSARKAEALRPGHGEITLGRSSPNWPAALLAMLGTGLAFAPAIDDLPWAGYAAIACWLFAGVAAVPWITQNLLGRVGEFIAPYCAQYPSIWLGLQRVVRSPGIAMQAIAGVVASMALVTAMAIMVTSFRSSVSTWLDQVLPATLYARLPSGAAQLSLEEQARLRQMPGVARIEFLRATDISLSNTRPSIPILGRPIDPNNPAANLPLTGPVSLLSDAEIRDGLIPIYVSEAMLTLYQFKLGQRVNLPISNRTDKPFKIVAVWRDYARQGGSIQINLADYIKLTGDSTVSDAAIWLKPETSVEAMIQSLQQFDANGRQLEWRSSQEIRKLSLTIFDRSFAVTYALEAAAILVALIGVAASFGAQALARQKEFATLAHLGVGQRQIDRQLAFEGALLTLTGSLWGCALGLAMSWVLITKVNPQSFHWTMQFDIPWLALLAGVFVITLCAAWCSRWAGQRAMGASNKNRAVLQAIAQDW